MGSRLKNIFSAFTRSERAAFIAASLTAIGAGIALAAIAIDRATVVVPAHGGSYIEGALGQPTYVNPILAERDADKNIVRLLFQNVTGLAEKIESDEAGRVYRVRLKENLHWSDGKKITTDDVIFTIQKIQDPETRSPIFASWQGVTANRLSELELQFNLVSPYPFFRENLERLYPVPKHLFADTPPANWVLSDYNLKPVGSGPYKFHAYEKTANGFIESYTLEPNADYAGDKAYIQEFGFRFYTKAEDMIGAFNTGVIDGFADFNPETFKAITRAYEAHSFTVPGYYAVFLNQNQNIALKEVEVRRALSELVNRTELLKTIFDERGKIAIGPIARPDQKFAEDPLFKSQEVGELLDKAGWARDEKGLRKKTINNASIQLKFDLVVPQIPFLEKTSETLREIWKSQGIEVTLVYLPAEDVTNRVIKNREYQAVIFGNVLNPLEDLYPFWHSNERFYPGLNLSLYTNKKADEIMEAIRRELDPNRRNESLKTLEETITKDFPAVFLYAPNYLYITSRDLKGVKTEELLHEPADRYRDISAWHLRTTRALR